MPFLFNIEIIIVIIKKKFDENLKKRLFNTYKLSSYDIKGTSTDI